MFFLLLFLGGLFLPVVAARELASVQVGMFCSLVSKDSWTRAECGESGAEEINDTEWAYNGGKTCEGPGSPIAALMEGTGFLEVAYPPYTRDGKQTCRFILPVRFEADSHEQVTTL